MAATTENKPLYAIAGAAEAAVEILRGLPSRFVDAASDTSLRDQVRAKVSELPEDAKTWRTGANELVEQLPAKAHEFPGRVSEFLANVSHDAGKTYDDLAVRGEGVVAKLRRDYGPKVDEVVDTVKSRVAKASDDVEETVSSLRAKATDAVGDRRPTLRSVPTADSDTAAPNAGTATKPATRRATKPATRTSRTATAKSTAAKSTAAKTTAAKTTATKPAATKPAATKPAATKSAAAKKTATKAANPADAPRDEA